MGWLRTSQKQSKSPDPIDQAGGGLALAGRKWHFSAPTLLYPVSSQRGSLSLNFQPDSSYQWCPISMIYVTGWLCFSGNFLLPHPLEIVGKGRPSVVSKIVSDGPEQDCMIIAITVICEAKARGSVSHERQVSF